MKKKKLFALALCIILVLGTLSACGFKEDACNIVKSKILEQYHNQNVEVYETDATNNGDGSWTVTITYSYVRRGVRDHLSKYKGTYTVYEANKSVIEVDQELIEMIN